jgi:hypothetical protein
MDILPHQRSPRFRNQQLFYLEQWIALLIGIVCLAVSAWAAFSGFQGPASVHYSWISESALPYMKYSLSTAVALIGTTLVRFAFYKRSPPNPAVPAGAQRPAPEEHTKGDPGAGSNLLKSVAVRRG